MPAEANNGSPTPVALVEELGWPVLLRRVAPQPTTLLLCGETGTGKTRLARLIHELSPRREEPFLVVDCGSLSPALLESEMFGHVRSAFNGADRARPGKLATAGRGTLLLDEVNSLPLPLQAKLVRAMDEGLFEPVGANCALSLQARLIAASSVDLGAEVAAGRFRADLFFRPDVVAFCLPPLRRRPAAIRPLVLEFLAEFTSRNRPDIRGIQPEALQVLQAYHWPGNIRELRNVVERAVALARGPDVSLTDLPQQILEARPGDQGCAEENHQPARCSRSRDSPVLGEGSAPASQG
jgi:two-component system response regulator HydG